MKYQDKLNSVPECPPVGCKKEQITAYRFVFDAMNNDSFLPVAIMDPSRIDNAREERIKCSMYALSMFVSEEKAMKHFNSLKKKNPNIAKSIGNNLAVGTIYPQDGLCSKPNRKGHFDMFEHVNTDLIPNFSISRQIEKV